MDYLLVGLGGFLGTNARYLVANWIGGRYGTSFPYGTLLINVSGSFIIGLFLILITERFLVHPHWRLFFAVGFLQAGSFLAASRLADRVGLLNTMVFTHLPSNLLLAAIPFAPNLGVALVLLLGRFAL